ncbi:hypothetical protein AXG93_242s1080 [Marchantia polymorpha subsp. ruderalis]|uniref:Uncharacterized protein n=1 Tax=Marchantia polymorpha subsp. ruderalis TaxID=1480154 RepID=A0A176VMT8_MARPO|nr:hypothetical protein AXG93_242s1080 [Marchantia polymorpha subsp. ruderalis]
MVAGIRPAGKRTHVLWRWKPVQRSTGEGSGGQGRGGAPVSINHVKLTRGQNFHLLLRLGRWTRAGATGFGRVDLDGVGGGSLRLTRQRRRRATPRQHVGMHWQRLEDLQHLRQRERDRDGDRDTDRQHRRALLPVEDDLDWLLD